MKFCVIQPYYSLNYKDVDFCFNEQMKLLDKCSDEMDVIVMPEYCDIPASTENDEQFVECMQKYGKIVKERVVETCKRCNAVIFANYGELVNGKYRNTTHVFNSLGEEVGKYYKAHPAPSEIRNKYMDCDYDNVAKVIEVDGIRYGFLTCYDFYFYEDFIKIARKEVDVIIGCSHQRADTHDALEIIGRFLSYNTNAYLIRSSVSLGKKSKICGCSMAVAPDGKMLYNMKSKIGTFTVDIDVKKKYYKEAGFKGALKPHWQYVDEGRKI